MKNLLFYNVVLLLSISILFFSCENKKELSVGNKSASEILGNLNYLAISYGGYREKTRDIQPTIFELKEDLKILSAMGVKILRTYNLQLEQAPNILKAIRELKIEDSSFEMYVKLGAWIDCENAWTSSPNHDKGDESDNSIEMQKAIDLANKYPDIVKIIAVGNEAMVHWASSYYVQPSVILKWVNHLQNLKKQNKLPQKLWITSSDNFASWGGGDSSYHTKDLTDLIDAVDYISMHTYAFHDTHYNSEFWELSESNKNKLSNKELIEKSMENVYSHAVSQYNSVKNYIDSLGINKPIHIGELGWATVLALYYKQMREWTNKEEISCFYFEAFDEPWKDGNPNGSENNFGLFTVDGKAKYALWDSVDKGVFKGLTRNGNFIKKTYNGVLENLQKDVLIPSETKSNQN
jgi:exo-beta-1,3-glucanase (GH17 family)